METMKKTLVYSRRPEIRRQRVAQCYVAAWMGGERRGGESEGRVYVYG